MPNGLEFRRRWAALLGMLLLLFAGLPVSEAQQNVAGAAARLNLQIIDEDREQPLSAVKVSINAGVAATAIGIGGATDDAGRLQLNVPDATPLYLTAYWNTHAGSVDPVQIMPLAAGENRDLTIRLPSRFDATMHVRLVDIDTGRPIPNAEVRVLQSLQHLPSVASGTRAQPSATSDADGRLTLQFPRGHDLVARAAATSYVPADFRLARGITTPERPLVLRLSQPATLKVNVTDAQGAIEPGLDIVVTARSFDVIEPRPLKDDALLFQQTMARGTEWRAKTSAEGALLTGLAAGVPLEVVISRDGQQLHRTQMLLRSATRSTYAWSASSTPATLQTPGRISGRLTNRARQAIAGHTLMLVPSTGSVRPSKYYLQGSLRSDALVAEVDKSGRFNFNRVPPGYWWIGPVPSGIWEQGALDAIPMDPKGLAPLLEQVIVRPGASIGIKVRRVEGLYLSGRLLDRDDTPLANHSIRLDISVPGGDSQLETRTASNGRFVFGPLDIVGKVRLSADLPLVETPVIEAGATNVVLRARDAAVAQPAGRLRVQLLDAASGAEVLAAVDAQALSAETGESVYLVADGSFAHSFAPGRVRIAARTAMGGFVQQEVEVQPGVEKIAQLRLQPGTSLRLRYANRVPARVHLLSNAQPKSYISADDLLPDYSRAVLAPGSYTIQFIDADNAVLLQQLVLLTAGEREFLVDLEQRTMQPAAE